MPNKQHYYAPDSIDCASLVDALAEEFGVRCEITTSYQLDEVIVICKCRTPAAAPDGLVQVQSLVRAALKSKRDLYVMQYSALNDCYHQLDRGVLSVATTPIERDWNGRPSKRGPRA